MKKNYYQLMTLILVMIFFIQSSQRIYSQESLSAETPFIEVNGKIVKFGSAIIAFSKLRQSNSNFDQKTVFSQIVQQLVNEELLSQNIDKENQLTLLALEHEKRSAKAAQMVSKILKNFPNDELLNSAYKNLTEQYKNALEYNASHILVKEEEQAKTILADLKGGKVFEEMAKEYSIGPTGKSGGNLDWFDLNRMVPEFSTALMVLSEGDISQPVKTKFGWHLIKLNETREKKIPELKDVKTELVQNLRQKKINDYLNSLTKNSEITFLGKDINPNEIANVKLLEKLDD
ncbi:MAG: peptidylprolyl isomerase [Paracoccaceae bacterium]